MKTKLFTDDANYLGVVTSSKDFASIAERIGDEIKKAQAKHPDLARTFADALIVINEELGEANRAYLQYQYEGGNWEEVRKELVQTGAMVFRVLLNLESYVEDIALSRIAEASKETLRKASPFPGGKFFEPVERKPTKSVSDIWSAILQSENEQVIADLKTPGNVSASKEIYEQQIGRGARTFSNADVERVATRISGGMMLCDSLGCPDCSKARYEAKKYLIAHPEEWTAAKENARNPYNFQAELYEALTGGKPLGREFEERIAQMTGQTFADYFPGVELGEPSIDVKVSKDERRVDVSASVPLSNRLGGKRFTRKELIQNLFDCTNPGGSFGLIIGTNTNLKVYRGKRGNRIVFSMINPMREDYDAFEAFLQDHRPTGFGYAHNSGVVMPDGKYKFNEVYKSADKSQYKPKS